MINLKDRLGDREEVRLGEYMEISRGISRHRPRGDLSILGGMYPLIQTADVTNSNLYIIEHSQTYNERGLQQSKLWNKGTLCMTIAANVGDTSILGFNACFPDSIVGLTPYNKNSLYYKYLLDANKNKLLSKSEGVAQKNLNVEKLRNFLVEIHSDSFQIKVSNFLSSIDILIEKQERYIKYLKEKKITSSKIILESNNTVKIKLCDMIERYSEKNKLNDLVPVAVGKYGIRKRDEIYSKELSSNYSQNKVIYQNTLTFGMGSKQIDFGILLTSDIYCVSPAYNTFKIKTDVINPYYLNELLSLNIKKLSAMFMITSARQGKAVEFDGLLNYYFDILPNIEEQNKIESLLSSMDKLIELNEEKLEELKRKKKYYLNEIFK